MLTALLIMLREGFEAALVVAIVYAYIRRIGRPDLVGPMWQGVAGAAALSVGAGVVIHLTVENLVGRPEYAAVEAELRAALAERFDFEAIEADIRRSIAARRLIREAMRRNNTLWDYTPAFDPNKDALQQYLR